MIQIIDFIKIVALNPRVFKKLCSDMDADHLVLFYRTQPRWLSKANVTRSFVEFKVGVCKLFANYKSYLQTQK